MRMAHVRGAPYHPMTQGKIERHHEGRGRHRHARDGARCFGGRQSHGAASAETAVGQRLLIMSWRFIHFARSSETSFHQELAISGWAIGRNVRWHQTLKNRILLENYYLPGD